MVASGFATVAMAASYAASSWNRGAGLVAHFTSALGAGVVAYAVVVMVLARRAARGRRNGARL
jgi:hypothetical protein